MAVTDMLSPITRPIYDRHYPGLKRFSWPWRILATYTSFMAWLFSTPWLAIRSIAPSNFQDNLTDIERGYFNFVTPLITFVQDTTYKAFSIADSTTDWAIVTALNVYENNLKGFEHTFDHFLRNVEHRMRILKDDGLNGITKAISYDVSHAHNGHHHHGIHTGTHPGGLGHNAHAPGLAGKLPAPVTHAAQTIGDKLS